jgi:hypothetical protein
MRPDRVAITSHCAGSALTGRHAISPAAGSQCAAGARRRKRGSGVRARGPIPELHISALGTLKNTSVFCPLFSAFSVNFGKVDRFTATLAPP